MFEYLCNSIIFATTDLQDMIKWKGVKFVGVKPSDSEKDFEDAFIRRLQESIREVKASREMGARYMTFQELLKDEREAGREEGISISVEKTIKILKKLGQSKEYVIANIAEEFSFTVEKATMYVEKYWEV